MGRVVKPHGITGELVVETFTEDPLRFEPGAVLLVGRTEAPRGEITVAASRADRGRLLVRLKGVEDRDAAEDMRGSLFFVSASELGSLDEDAFWEHELVGARVVDRDQRHIGSITRVVPRFEQDLWEVDSGRGRLLIPASKQIVVSVDIEQKSVVIDPPPGLLDEDAL